MHTDMKFFTNEPDKDLYSRFSAILKSNTQLFDVLVGYYRTSGFFKMADALKDVEKIRILIGLNDKLCSFVYAFLQILKCDLILKFFIGCVHKQIQYIP